MNKLWNFLNTKLFLLIITILLMLIQLNTCSNLKEEKRKNIINEQNKIALSDTLRIQKLKTGELEASISGYISSEKKLKELNERLYEETKKQRGDLLSLNRIVFQLKQDKDKLQEYLDELLSKINQPVKINDSTYLLTWVLRYNWDDVNYDQFNGSTYVTVTVKDGFLFIEGMDNLDFLNNAIKLTHLNTELTERETQIELVYGQRVEDNKLRVFARSNYPGFSPQSLEGVLIDPNTSPYIKQLMKKKKFFPNTWSVGVGPSFGYDIVRLQPYIGFGVNINYNLYQW